MIQAIKTRYADVVYRSRTEARWAVFFDQMNVPARYEHEGYKTSHGNYLPDFRLIDAPEPTFFEVKPGAPTRDEMDRMSALARQLDAHVFVAEGEPSANCIVWKVLRDRMRDEWEFAVSATSGELRLVRDLDIVFLTTADYEDWRDGWVWAGPAWQELERAGNHQFPIYDDDPPPRFNRNRHHRGFARSGH